MSVTAGEPSGRARRRDLASSDTETSRAWERHGWSWHYLPAKGQRTRLYHYVTQ